MDWEFIGSVLPEYLRAAGLTFGLGGLEVVLSLICGLVCALVRYWQLPLLSQVVGIYIELSRNTPLLIQLFFLYYALPKLGITWPSTVCALVGLTFLGSSYMAEAFRSGLEAVPKSQLEGAYSLALSRRQCFRYVVLPQALASSIPALMTNVIFLIKETSMFSIVALADLMYVAKEHIGLYYKTDEALFLLVLAYTALLLPLSLLGHVLERRLHHGQFGHRHPL
ncbi:MULTISPECIES: amino acid ABC transporter permease [Aerococcus]|uniref:Amino acid ABC transporter permease n=1 Tax=Aerococcus sanguinicola TaxID=119206 RepID=A0A5N1GLZ9_9LACT|nr:MULTISPECIES: amino acid ABC transporter permease [Aerococcus]KAA9301308.1 amino acid ABC transporter permease [Aerococcus sanguinicola]MDK6370055.1 amino acid ABC transporter permease [Aerococcus sp. UMB9870]MDK6680679.1 amino acid ABC transporter permease [Aerococcus sp. UMB8608]MDK6687454.1 amino acid ABC transporter permease [Aerococcus sp. UMB8623]MDK6940629.1 amino acid ABC transporter permease [Aerococcus sp. UMB8487]